MPVTTSAKKALRQSTKRRQANQKNKRAVDSAEKQIKKLVKTGKRQEALQYLPRAYKVLDKAAKKGVIEKNTAARKKSRLAKLINRR
ncbi:MAG: 30S ribosomal protein S20 [Candidatus Terrybacteria bacterium RIFCSPLOWO2_01_FULL_44_24]|uniref:Small ribosomal subunit protein bS20 n=1 Tax=Candidatus Terrybacteria bacterium RIFCSPHIGHO2_01_FULL_43_35 TaxID=1802361 RepID=A0A1G2PEB0_9BACT|nr:MAG: 30S ribosomal protein S20 [Candidatus Terrybacteria bacterium RIFCSPHIGHO2_01_FULL_43_35]OHA50885.1 MAG: 30S ribosomal protein S20 [Candidatus Terrybacteria bacterium RIFCSPLOWO2_01_FULL_44_24]